MELSNAFRQAVGLPLIAYHHKGAMEGPHHAHGHHVHAHEHHHHRHHGKHHHGRMGAHGHKVLNEEPFFPRLHFALMALGPWEGRAVAFVLGCGIGVLLRMMWVLLVVTLRTIKGSPEPDTNGEYQHILFEPYDAEEIFVAPPTYHVDEKLPIVEEESVESKKDGEETK